MKDIVKIVGGTREFEKLLKLIVGNGTEIKRYHSPGEAVNAGPSECLAYFILPDYENGKRAVPEMSFETIKKFMELREKGQRLFIENYMACNYLHSNVFGHQVDGMERSFFNEYLVASDELADTLDSHIFQARNSYYYPGREMGSNTEHGKKVFLSASDCIGTHSVYKKGSFEFPILGRVHNFFYSAMNLTQYNPLMMLPFFQWKELFSFIFKEIIGVEKEKTGEAFEKVFKPISSYGQSGNSLENAVEKAVKWHFDSGLMLSDDGSKGIFEMITSYNLKPRANIRTDSEMLTGFLCCLAGKRKGDEGLVKTGKNLIEFLFDNGIQIEEGDGAGLLKWFYDLDAGFCFVWSSDTSRGGLALINMYKLFKEKIYLERAVKLGDGILRWLEPGGLLGGCFNYKRGYGESKSAENISDNPVYYGEMTSFLLQLYKHTGDLRYKNAVLNYANKIMEKFPDIKPFGFSDNFTYSRYLLMLSCIQENLSIDLSGRINDCLGFFENIQYKTGGLRETPIRLVDHAEAGVGIGDSSDDIADILYCNNFILCALSVICHMKNPFSVDMARADRIFGKLKNFILSIQIKDSGKSFDGGWMRAFDMRHNEYYGLNKDKDWGPYCIMAGWMTGFIPLVFLNELGEESLFV